MVLLLPEEEASQHQMSTFQTDESARPAMKETSGAHQGTPSDDTPTIIKTRPPLNVTPLHQLDEQPAYIDCPFCELRTQTRVTHEDSTSTQYVEQALFLWHDGLSVQIWLTAAKQTSRSYMLPVHLYWRLHPVYLWLVPGYKPFLFDVQPSSHA